MTFGPLSAGNLGFEAFGTACGLAVVAGALSVVVPTFDVLTATLVALALAGWASLHRREGRRPGRPTGPVAVYTASFAVLATAVAVFFEAPGPWAPWRALVLGLGVVPLWAVERRGPWARRSLGRWT